ncbi:radical SAM protein [candidate division KSB3 bacterium]|uniref:Radical SAM protein n=1 Tax=candidate division KSB3 bacterium TaxID=2044937 RepID=A0A2G6E7B3_9BACT|nr:MAG: radical SAM protein [candidate division KSB3 bacterium]PIE30243.1 MAG: radical SAM protein [candidate division KSB3 bacterium]
MKKKIISIFVPQQGCSQSCSFCHQANITGVNTLAALSPDRLRQQIDRALHEPKSQDRNVDFDLAFYGGSFTGLPLAKQQELLHTVQDYVDRGKISGIRLSTHPAMFNEEILNVLRRCSVRLVELGVQSFDDRVLELAGRQHTAADVVTIVRALHEQNIKVGIHLMIGLPGDSHETSLRSARQTIDVKPDSVRIHPCLVIQGTRLAALYRTGQYQPLSLEAAVQTSKEMLALFKFHHLPVTRIGLQTTSSMEQHLLAGPYHPAFRQLVESAMFYDRMAARIEKHNTSMHTLVFHVSPQDLSTARGQKNSNLRKLRDTFHAHNIRIIPESTLERGDITLSTFP